MKKLFVAALAAFIAISYGADAQQIGPGGFGGGGTPGGSSGQLQYNNSGAFGGLSFGPNLANAGGQLNLTQPVSSITASTYTVQATDAGTILNFSTTFGTQAVTLPQAATTGFTDGFSFTAENSGTGSITITPTMSTINGASTVFIPPNQSCVITSKSSNYVASSCTALVVGNPGNLLSNTAAGAYACNAVTGGQNTCVGESTGGSIGSGQQNTGVGFNALLNNNGSSNTCVGVNCLAGSGGSFSNSGLGQSAGDAITGGHNDTVVGFQVGHTTLQSGNGDILMGTSSAVDTPTSSTSNYLNIGNALILDMNLPTISSGFGTSPSVANGTSNGAFTVNVGTGGTANSGVIAFTNASPHGWACTCSDQTTASSTVFMCKAKSSSTTSATLTNYNTSGAVAAWVASDILEVKCLAY